VVEGGSAVEWLKAPESLVKMLESAMQGVDCVKRPMFGYPAYFINRNMFMGLFQASVFARLSPAQLMELRKKYPSLANLEPMPGRPMKAYYVIPEAVFSNPKSFTSLINKAAEHARSLPEKPETQPKKMKRSKPKE
jgi:TfoX/Sxy family transcriptional regulator of competence genes